MASREFVENFLKVSKNYLLEDCGEMEIGKQCARYSMAEAEICFAAFVREITQITLD